VRSLSLEDFRSYSRIDLALAPGITAFTGPNGAGKTNLLEAIHLVARGDSERARDDTEMVRWGAGFARTACDIERAEDGVRVEVLLFAPAPPERRRPRRYLVNGVGRRADDALGLLTVVAFFPEDVELLAQAPSARRRYLDAMLAQVDRTHRAEVREHQRVLEQRNALLRALRDEDRGGTVDLAELAFWDTELCRLAGTISARRLAAVRQLAPVFRQASDDFSGAHAIELAYAGQVEGDTAEERRDAYARLIPEKRERELWQGTTLVGPHREDLVVSANGRTLPSFASRGEQRSAVLALKLAEAAWLRDRTGDIPVFLLDDVLSELDPARRDALVDALPPDAQALVTAAHPGGLPVALLERAAVVTVPEDLS
jgi:DNA replication and repair protein RecF